MRKVQGVVTSVDVPRVAHLPGTFVVKIAVAVKRGYATPDDGESWYQYDRRVALTSKREVFLNYRPSIGQKIECFV